MSNPSSSPSTPPPGASPAAYARLFDVVLSVAAAPPDRPGTNVWAAKVPWYRIVELREALDACGIDWRASR